MIKEKVKELRERELEELLAARAELNERKEKAHFSELGKIKHSIDFQSKRINELQNLLRPNVKQS